MLQGEEFGFKPCFHFWLRWLYTVICLSSDHGTSRSASTLRSLGGSMMHPVMAISERFAGSWDAAARHAEQVYSVAAGAKPPPGVENVSRSWERSANRHRVDSGDSRAPNILTFGELKNFREPLDELIFSAQEEIN
jgi:hypothetical protein